MPKDGPIPRPDLIIVARGGGSLEDLWGFNEEIVVRAAAASEIPLISAVGHETDTTLIDFAADRRAPTPTAAAEMAVPVRAELAATLADFGARQQRAILRPVQLGRERLEARAQRLPRPEALLQPQAQRLDELTERLRRGLMDSAARGRQRLGELRLSPAMLQGRWREAKARLDAQRLSPALIERPLAERRERLAAMARVMRSLDPDAVLQRGYVRVTDADGQTLASMAAAAGKPELALHFRDGTLPVFTAAQVADGPNTAPPPAPVRPKRKAAPSGDAPPRQDDLFGQP